MASKISRQRVLQRDSVLQALYNDPAIGLVSAKRFVDRVPKAITDEYKLTKKDIEEFVKKQQVVQLTTRVVKGAPLPILSYSPLARVQADLFFFKHFIILNIVDVYSRYAMSKVIKDKSAITVTKAFNELIDAATEVLKSSKHVETADKNLVRQLDTDNGTEFINKLFQEMLKKREIKHKLNVVGDHRAQSIVERFNRTMRNLLTKHSLVNTKDKLPLESVITNYNTHDHDGVDEIPLNVFIGLAAPSVRLVKETDLRKAAISLYQPGDTVRKIRNKTAFEKGAEPNYTTNTFTIMSVVNFTYVLSDGSKGWTDRLLARGDAAEATSGLRRQHKVPARFI